MWSSGSLAENFLVLVIFSFLSSIDPRFYGSRCHQGATNPISSIDLDPHRVFFLLIYPLGSRPWEQIRDDERAMGIYRVYVNEI